MRSAQAGTAPLTGQPRPGGRRRARGAVSRLPTRRAGAAPAGKTQVTSVFLALAPGLLQTAMRSARHRETGFTLIELLVVVAIIGSLAAIAIPQFASQKGKGYDARVMQDARNAATGEEAYFSDTLTYFTGNCAAMPGVVLSPGMTCTATGAPSSFTITTRHPQATRTCTWWSNTSPNLSCS